jgi:hypothetical protein
MYIIIMGVVYRIKNGIVRAARTARHDEYLSVHGSILGIGIPKEKQFINLQSRSRRERKKENNVSLPSQRSDFRSSSQGSGSDLLIFWSRTQIPPTNTDVPVGLSGTYLERAKRGERESHKLAARHSKW